MSRFDEFFVYIYKHMYNFVFLWKKSCFCFWGIYLIYSPLLRLITNRVQFFVLFIINSIFFFFLFVMKCNATCNFDFVYLRNVTYYRSNIYINLYIMVWRYWWIFFFIKKKQKKKYIVTNQWCMLLMVVECCRIGMNVEHVNFELLPSLAVISKIPWKSIDKWSVRYIDVDVIEFV